MRISKLLLPLFIASVLLSKTWDREFLDNAYVLADELNMYKISEDEGKLEQDKIIQESFSEEAIRYREVKSINSDTLGWIRIEGTKVDYPIMYSEDNNHYLDYNYKGQKDTHGAIYLDAYSKGKWGKVNLIHGHSMRDGSMFKALLNYPTQSFYDSHKIIKIFDGFRLKEYEVFSVFLLDATKDTIKLYHETDEEYETWVDSCLNRSLVSGGVVYDKNDVLVLNTCSYQFSGSHTIVVATRKS